jgi:hypothetical protein
MTSPYLAAGITAIAELTFSRLSAIVPSKAPEGAPALLQTLTKYISGDLSFDECRHFFLTTIQQDEAVVRLRDILLVSDEPMPDRSNAPSNSVQALRRSMRPWIPAEDNRLLAGILRFGLENWQSIAEFVGNGRSRAQCSQRWTRGLNPRISKKPWSAEEERRLLELVDRYGQKNWARIASIFGNRCDVQCRYHYQQTVARRNALMVKECRKPPGSGEGCGEAGIALASSAMPLPQSSVVCARLGVVGCDPDSLNLFLRAFQ